MPRGQRGWSTKERFETLYMHNHDTDCWIWQGGKNNIGYGMFRDGKKMRTAHRVSYELFNRQKIPKYMCVCHSCDQPLCVNPDHLWLGTMKDNMQDMASKGRANPWGGATRKGIKQPLRSCKVCGVIKPANTIGRYHNDKCKNVAVSINTIYNGQASP